MLKLKIAAITGVLALVGIVLSGSRHFSSEAKGEVLAEIANYKSWSRINKEPIAVKIDESSLAGG